MMKKIEGDLANMVLRETFRPHTLISHCIPSRPMENLRRAQRLIASARRRWHEVQAHWRVTRKPGGFLCEPSSRHIWSERDDSGRSYCQTCEARRVWIVSYRMAAATHLSVWCITPNASLPTEGVDHDYSIPGQPAALLPPA